MENFNPDEFDYKQLNDFKEKDLDKREDNWNDRLKPKKKINASTFNWMLGIIVFLILLVGVLFYLGYNDKFKSEVNLTCSEIPACPTPPACNCPACPTSTCPANSCNVNLTCSFPNEIKIINSS